MATGNDTGVLLIRALRGLPKTFNYTLRVDWH